MQFHSPDAFKVAARFAGDSTRVWRQVDDITRRNGMRLRTAVRGHASGRPGPRARTGDYRRSITLEMAHSSFGVQAVVGTSAPQGRRLEFGFVGADARGRIYNQAPLPHFGPALDEIEPQYLAELDRAVSVL